MNMTQTTQTTRYCCKSCGAETPAGIGYVVNPGQAMPDGGMKAWCAGAHKDA